MTIFAAVFGLVFVSELPGKTTFATILLAARAEALAVFLGACAAFSVHVAIAAAAGRILSLLPARPLQGVVGVVFLFAAGMLWFENPSGAKHERTPEGFARTLAGAFGVVFMAQWGDPSQLATAALAAKYGPSAVFAPATLAFWSIAALASAAGHHSKKKLPVGLLQKTAAAVFALLGLGLLARSLGS